jgi:hypothetical protein
MSWLVSNWWWFLIIGVVAWWLLGNGTLTA